MAAPSGAIRCCVSTELPSGKPKNVDPESGLVGHGDGTMGLSRGGRALCPFVHEPPYEQSSNHRDWYNTA